MVEERLAAGWVGIEQVRALGRLAANPRCGHHPYDDDETWIPQLLDLASRLPLTDFRLVVDRWEQLADADGTGGERAFRRRGVQLSIVGDAAVLTGRFDAAVGDGGPVEVTVNLVVATALPPSVLLSAALAGRVRSVVTDPQDVVCVGPGGGTSHTQIDHLDPWSRGGPTDPANAAPLCGWHNRWKHDHRYRIRRHGDGRYLVTRPDRTMMWVGTRPEELRGHSRPPTR